MAINETYKGFSKKRKILSVLPLPYTRSDARCKTDKGGSKPQGQFDPAHKGFEQTLDFQYSKYTRAPPKRLTVKAITHGNPVLLNFLRKDIEAGLLHTMKINQAIINFSNFSIALAGFCSKQKYPRSEYLKANETPQVIEDDVVVNIENDGTVGSMLGYKTNNDNSKVFSGVIKNHFSYLRIKYQYRESGASNRDYTLEECNFEYWDLAIGKYPRALDLDPQLWKQWFPDCWEVSLHIFQEGLMVAGVLRSPETEIIFFGKVDSNRSVMKGKIFP
jgi:hypothetical protein